MRRAKNVPPHKNSSKSRKTSRNATLDKAFRIVNKIPPDLPILEVELSIIEAYLNEVLVCITKVQN